MALLVLSTAAAAVMASSGSVPPSAFPAAPFPSAASPVWPPPQSISLDGAKVPIHPGFTFSVHPGSVAMDGSGRLARACARFNAMVGPMLAGTPAGLVLASPTALTGMTLSVSDGKLDLGIGTDYTYSIRVNVSSTGRRVLAAEATTIYGAMYAIETAWQLLEAGESRSALAIIDGPKFAWRGLMIDAGRRFFPVPLVQNLLDTMAGAKMNVLHLHASDMCRFGVESKLYPNLTDALTGIHAGFYTQDDVRALISYAADRGIRVVPEFDFPGHSRGYIPVESEGLDFCVSDSPTRDQLFGSAGTYKVVHDLMKEMSELFTDEVFNIGCDETSAKGICTVNSTFAVERKLFEAIATEFGKTPEGWEEAYFDAGAATNNTIVNAWARHTAAEITKTGRRAVESKAGSFYFTGAAKGGPAGWSKCWYDIGTNVPADEMHLLLGGEMSMWSDSYCYIDQCGSSTGGAPVGHALFDPAMDTEFGQSIGGMIWPRGFVGAAAFWSFDAATDPASPAFAASIYKLSDSLAARGSLVCPTNCSCDQLSACGKPYIQPKPLGPGAPVGLSECDVPGEAASHQTWSLSENGTVGLGGAGGLLCLATGPTAYPLVLASCDPAAASAWKHDPASAEFVLASSGHCIDADHTAHTVGTWECGSGGAQANQHWSYDPATGLIVSLDTVDGIGGLCLTAGAAAPGPDKLVGVSRLSNPDAALF